MKNSPIRSQAQHAMMTRAATDAKYAASRGMDVTTAQRLLDEHKRAGSPELPERVSADAVSSRPKAKPMKLLGSR